MVEGERESEVVKEFLDKVESIAGSLESLQDGQHM